MTDQPIPAEITKADREAVAAFHKQSFKALFDGTEGDIDNGINRAHELLCQAFAAHRIAAKQACSRHCDFLTATAYDCGHQAGVEAERARIVAWLRGEFCRLRQHPEDQAFARHIANAIEKGEHHG